VAGLSDRSLLLLEVVTDITDLLIQGGTLAGGNGLEKREEWKKNLTHFSDVAIIITTLTVPMLSQSFVTTYTCVIEFKNNTTKSHEPDSF